MYLDTAVHHKGLPNVLWATGKWPAIGYSLHFLTSKQKSYGILSNEQKKCNTMECVSYTN